MSNTNGSENRDSDMSMQQAQPYRSPSDVGDPPRNRWAKPFAWLFTLGVFGLLGSMVLARTWTSEETVNDESNALKYVEDFGDVRRSGQPPDFDFPNDGASETGAEPAVP